MLNWLFHPETLPFLVNWEAWATFCVGVAAVLGAWRVGNRQARIAEKQTEILDSQSRLANLQLRADLYDRRMKVYAAIREYAHLSSTGNKVSMDVQRPFYEALNASRFLFGAELQQWVRQLLSAAIKLQVASQRLGRSSSPTEEMADTVFARQDELSALLNELDARFAPYLGFEEGSIA